MTLSKHTLTNKAQYLRSLAYKSIYFTTELLRSVLSLKPRLKILFSIDPDFRKPITTGFKGSGHKLYFDDFNEESIKGKDLLVPIGIPDIKFVSNLGPIVNALPIPKVSAVDICDDKYEFYQVLTKKGFGKYLPAISDDLSYPYVLKKRKSNTGKDTFIITNKEQEDEHRDQIGASGFFRQQMIEGSTEFATHMIYKQGRIIATLTIKHGFGSETSINGQIKSISRNLTSCPYLDIFGDMLKAIDFEGLCCFDYKVLNGQPYIFEINPRFGASLGPYFFSFLRRIRKS